MGGKHRTQNLGYPAGSTPLPPLERRKTGFLTIISLGNGRVFREPRTEWLQLEPGDSPLALTEPGGEKQVPIRFKQTCGCCGLADKSRPKPFFESGSALFQPSDLLLSQASLYRGSWHSISILWTCRKAWFFGIHHF